MKKLFWDDPYLTECKAKITEVNGNTIKLDQTIFYAFSGGQASDEGTIGGIEVVGAIKQGDKENIIDIEYNLDKEPNFKVGDEVVIKINPERRAKLRNLHSAAHVFYYILIGKIGRIKIIGANVSENRTRVDFLYEEPITEKVKEIEDKTNNFIQEDHKIEMKPDEKKPDLRWWVCEDWKMPCGGTHVKSTKEIGNIKLKRKNIGKGKERIELTLV